MPKYDKKTQALVKREMERLKKGRWKSIKQAIAVALSEARKKGFKAPHRKKTK